MRPLCVCLAAIICATSANTLAAAGDVPAEIRRSRDLRLYDYGGVYSTAINGPEAANIDKVRRFIWEHWSNKRRGYVRLLYRYSDSGERSYVFIEPSHDRWHISWWTVDYSVLPEEWPPRQMRDIVTVERCRNALIFFDAKDRIVTTL